MTDRFSKLGIGGLAIGSTLSGAAGGARGDGGITAAMLTKQAHENMTLSTGMTKQAAGVLPIGGVLLGAAGGASGGGGIEGTTRGAAAGFGAGLAGEFLDEKNYRSAVDDIKLGRSKIFKKLRDATALGIWLGAPLAAYYGSKALFGGSEQPKQAAMSTKQAHENMMISTGMTKEALGPALRLAGEMALSGGAGAGIAKLVGGDNISTGEVLFGGGLGAVAGPSGIRRLVNSARGLKALADIRRAREAFGGSFLDDLQSEATGIVGKNLALGIPLVGVGYGVPAALGSMANTRSETR